MSDNNNDFLACPYPDCLRYINHHGPHEFSWGDSIPWPPEADLDDQAFFLSTTTNHDGISDS